MFLSHKIRLYPNNKQETYLIKSCRIKRFAYNWALEESQKLYEQGIKTNGYDLSKRFNAIKKEKFPFVLEVSKWVVQKAIHDVYDAYVNWWKKKAKRPKFKKRGRCRECFYIGLNHVKVDGNYIRIPLLSSIRMAQSIRFPGRVMSTAISKENGRWFASITVEISDSEFVYAHACENQAVCGADLGVWDLVVLDDGRRFPIPARLSKLIRKLPRMQRRISRRIKGSNRRRKGVQKLNNLYFKIKNIRSNFINCITSFLVSNYIRIGIEDLGVEQMLKNKWYAKSISNASFYELRRQLEYKTKLSGSVLVKADKFFPSSKTCSSCGAELGSLPLNIRTWTCPLCDAEHDRDINAAINLRNVALRYRETENARGDHVRPRKRQRSAKRESGNRQLETVTV